MTHFTDGLTLADAFAWPVAAAAVVVFAGLATGALHARRRARRLPPDHDPDGHPRDPTDHPDLFPRLGPPVPPSDDAERHSNYARGVFWGVVLLHVAHTPVAGTTLVAAAPVAAPTGALAATVVTLGQVLVVAPAVFAAVGLHARVARAVPGDDADLRRLEATARPAAGVFGTLYSVLLVTPLALGVVFVGGYALAGPVRAAVAAAAGPTVATAAGVLATLAALVVAVVILQLTVVPQARRADAFLARHATSIGLHAAAGAAPPGATLPSPKPLCLGCARRGLVGSHPLALLHDQARAIERRTGDDDSGDAPGGAGTDGRAGGD